MHTPDLRCAVRFLTSILLILPLVGVTAQSTNLPTDRDLIAPLSASRLAATYYDIEFSPAQRDSLGDEQIELIMMIDTGGRASLYATNNVTDPVIIDSLRQRTEALPLFTPAIFDGRVIESVYTLYFSFPNYRRTFSGTSDLAYEYRRYTLEDFDYLERSQERIDILFAGAVNQFIGRPSRFLSTGGGMKVDIIYTDPGARAYGLFMSFYGNHLRRPYPIVTTRELNPAPPTLLVGLLYGRYFDAWSMQGELGYAQQNLSPRLGDDDNDWLRASGASLGIVLSRSFALGPGRFDYLYGSPTVSAGHISLHCALRYQHYDLNEASGLMAEVGIGYRLSTFRVESFGLKRL